MKMSKKFIKMCEVYKLFINDEMGELDFSKSAQAVMYKSETFGGDKPMSDNGFYVGKRWSDATVKSWKETIKNGELLRRELYEDGKFPHWWLDKVLGSEL